jgi:hypothetical protein
MTDFVQGTVVKLTYTIKDLDTGDPIDPPDTTVTVTDRAGDVQTVSFSQNEIYRMSEGTYRAKIDTSSLSIGGCVYEITALGTDESTMQGEFFVIARVGP